MIIRTIPGFFLCIILLVSGNASAQHAGHGADGEDITVTLKAEPSIIKAGSPATILFSLKDRQGRPTRNLSIHHDRLLHVVIASRDFSVFAHIHPEDLGPITPLMKSAARYPVRFIFPKAGRYIVGLDFSVEDRLYSRHFLVDVPGGPEMGQVKRDFAREKRVGDLDVAFSYIPAHITAGKEVTLSYVFRKNGKDVADLEPYLSAPMHLAIISNDLTHFIHAHGELPGMSSMGQHEHHMHMATPNKFGPKIEVHAVFPTKGLYQIFGQVGHDGNVLLTSFMVEVDGP